MALRKGPGENYGKVKAFVWDDEPQRSVYLSPGDYVEVVDCKDGYAKVKEHLYADQTETLWNDKYGWVPTDCLRKP